MAQETRDDSKTTIYDVAEHAGVAISTVSRVLNESRDVSDSTRETVLKAIQKLQFRPNRTAKSLAQRATRTIAVAVPTFTTPFHNELLKGVRSELDGNDLDLLLCDLAWEAPKMTLQKFLARGAMDGLLVAGLPVDEEIADELKTLGAPVVLIGTQWDDMDSFYWDEEPGSQQAVEHLIEQGHTDIAMITTPHDDNRLRNARVNGYKAALEAAGLEFNPERIAQGRTKKHDGFSEESGYEAMEVILEQHPDVTAVFASSDVQAIGAWQAIRHAGKSVPEDIALIGYDDIKISRFIGLSSVAQNMHDVGEEATNVLLQRLRRSNTGQTMSKLIRPTLKIRKSSGGKDEKPDLR
ncbi:LacI family transcriptional regulator [Longibacter salinarum]|uniref:LacI family transcriptional regulator n=1 Tax=Longibacter salinarum TaxID=1850348 RepID=A0A2A8D2F7_9BACT|nr:LacI family DNA-binding transcriptional regulator [Longibacter salinarum]PEN15060.1 LacI family transcriptional regulator [Longibacter salinarum]